MFKMETTITGEREVARKLELLAKKSVDAVERVVAKSVLVVEARAKKEVRVLTGRLRASITFAVTEKKPVGIAKWEGETVTRLTAKAPKGQVVGVVGSGVKYAPHQEFGTSRMRGKPYLLPALKHSEKDILKFLKTEFRKLRI